MGIRAKQAYFISPPVVLNGLVYYVDAANQSSYPGSGATWTDLIASNAGTLVNSPTYDTSVGGNLQFNGTTQYATFNGVSLGTVHSVEMWIKTPVSPINPSNPWIWSTEGSTTRYFEYTGNNIYFYVNNVVLVAYNVVPTLGTWHHAVFARNNTSCTLYINGLPVFNNADIGWSGYTFTLSRISNNALPAEGSIASVKAYNRSLSAQEVTQNYNAHKARFGLL